MRQRVKKMGTSRSGSREIVNIILEAWGGWMPAGLELDLNLDDDYSNLEADRVRRIDQR